MNISICRPGVTLFRGCFLVLVTFGVFESAANAGFEWSTSVGGNGHYYELVLPTDPSGNFTWFQARDAAAASIYNGSAGHLVTVTSSAEDDFLRSAFESSLKVDNLPGSSGDFAWIGLTDVAQTGNFQWITGEPFTYSNWAPPEPNFLGIEHYGQLWVRDYHDGAGPIWSWNNSQPGPGIPRWDTGLFGYIVEFDGPFTAAVPEPSTLIILGIGSLMLFGRQFWYGRRNGQTGYEPKRCDKSRSFGVNSASFRKFTWAPSKR